MSGNRLFLCLYLIWIENEQNYDFDEKNYIILVTSSSFACRFAVARDWGAWLKLLICYCSNCQLV